jgi:hypothetical protein
VLNFMYWQEPWSQRDFSRPAAHSQLWCPGRLNIRSWTGSASPVVQANGQAYRKRSRVQRYYRHKRPPAGQYDYSYGTYPFHSYYGLRAWYPPTATFDYPLLW